MEEAVLVCLALKLLQRTLLGILNIKRRIVKLAVIHNVIQIKKLFDFLTYAKLKLSKQLYNPLLIYKLL